MKPTDEQLREAYESAALGSGRDNAKFSRLFFEASCKIALADPTDPDNNDAWEAELNAITATWNWYSVRQELESLRGCQLASKVKQMVRDAYCIGYTNLRRSLTEPEKDEAVEWVTKQLVRKVGHTLFLEDQARPIAREIVAAVRKADAK